MKTAILIATLVFANPVLATPRSTSTGPVAPVHPHEDWDGIGTLSDDPNCFGINRGMWARGSAGTSQVGRHLSERAGDNNETNEWWTETYCVDPE